MSDICSASFTAESNSLIADNSNLFSAFKIANTPLSSEYSLSSMFLNQSTLVRRSV